MTQSMTAFARRHQSTTWGKLCWELRSVNHRYLDITPHLPESLRALEPEIRQRIAAYLGRGKLECTLRLQPDSAKSGITPRLQLNYGLLNELAHICNQVETSLHRPTPLSALEVLRWPGVIATSEAEQEELASCALVLLEETLNELVTIRKREGARLKDIIEERRNSAQDLIKTLRNQLPEIHTQLRQRFTQRLSEFKANLDPGRLEQEVLILLQKMDVDEELTRIEAHLHEVARVIQQEGPIGRRLDFLLQELGREANTLGSKSGDLTLTQSSVELKVLIEQMREQIQNIE